jgi:type I restriction enzyme S subunit
MRYLSNASTIGIMNQEKTKDIIVPLPSTSEQFKIREFLDEQVIRIRALIAEAERAIALLQERRTALISAAVTGKIDVRDLVGRESGE